MKKLLCAVFAFVALTLQTLSAQIQGQWTTTGTMQTEREFNAQVRLLTGAVLSVGGVDNAGNILSTAELYTPPSVTWTLTASMSDAREHFAAVVLASGKVLVVGGVGPSSTILGAAELYDPITKTWSSAGSLSVPRAAHTATLLASGKVLITGGCTSSPTCTATAVSELYDPVSNSWSVSGSLNTPRASHTAVHLGSGKVLVIGGSNGTVTTSCELYDPAKGTWSIAASTSTARYLNTSTLLPNGKVLVAGGTPSRGPENSAELYDPVTNTWTPTGNMTSGRYAHTATLLPDGTVLMVGGVGQSISCGKACTGYIPFSKAEIYHIATGTFTAVAPLSRALAYQSAILLRTGRALVNGGLGYTATCCVVVNTSEYYVPLTLSFSATSMNFGLLQTGLTSPAQTVTITNSSAHSVTFSNIAASGDFAQTTTCPSTLNSGQSCTLSITFSPLAAGTLHGAVTFKDNSPGSPEQNIALTGTGEILSLGFSPASLNLGSVAVGSSSAQSVTLVNDGSAPVNVSGISVIPANGTYTQTNNCPATLGVQQTCVVSIVFTPPDVFTYKASVSVSNSVGAPAKLALTGTGLDGP